MSGRCFKLSPSDFAFLWKECRRCFWLKVVAGFDRARQPMPSIFNAIDAAMKERFEGRRVEEAETALMGGVFRFADRWVVSAPIEFPGREDTCFLRGKVDSVVDFDDGSYGIIDFKTSAVRPQNLAVYSRQLHAYALGLERPSPDGLHLHPVRRLGLMVFEPQSFDGDGPGLAALKGKLAWNELPRDDEAFMKFLGEVMDVLALPELPEPGPSCDWCRYLRASAERDIRP